MYIITEIYYNLIKNRDDVIRTHDFLFPKQTRYRTASHLEKNTLITNLHKRRKRDLNLRSPT